MMLSRMGCIVCLIVLTSCGKRIEKHTLTSYSTVISNVDTSTYFREIIPLHQDERSTSPDGNFRIEIEVNEEVGDLQEQYTFLLKEVTTGEEFSLVQCMRHDWPQPNFYWDAKSQFVILEDCAESLKDSHLKVIDLKTREVNFEIEGLIGNYDERYDQYDSTNQVLIYFCEMGVSGKMLPVLCSVDLKNKEIKELFMFEEYFDFEFSRIIRNQNKRQLQVTYNIDDGSHVEWIQY